MPDLATLAIEITTNLGDSQAKLEALSKSADHASDKLVGVEKAAAGLGPGITSASAATDKAATGFSGLGTATGQAQRNLSGVGAASQAAISNIVSIGAATGATSKGLEATGAGAKVASAAILGLTPAMRDAAISAATLGSGFGALKQFVIGIAEGFGLVSSKFAAVKTGTAEVVVASGSLSSTMATVASVLPRAATAASGLAKAQHEVEGATHAVEKAQIRGAAHGIHFIDRAAMGTISMRQLASAMHLVSGGLSALSAATGISIGVLAGFTIVIVLLLVELFKTAKGIQDLERSIDDMSKGAAKGADITASSFAHAAEQVAKMTGESIKDINAVQKDLTKTGKVMKDDLAGYTMDVSAFARQSGESFTEMGKKLADIAKDPGAGIEVVRDNLKTLTQAELENIKTLAAGAEPRRATAAIFAVIHREVLETIKPLDGLTWTVNKVSGGFHHALETILRTVGVLQKLQTEETAATAATDKVAAATKTAASVNNDHARSITAAATAERGKATVTTNSAAAEVRVTNALRAKTQAVTASTTAERNSTVATIAGTAAQGRLSTATRGAGQSAATATGLLQRLRGETATTTAATEKGAGATKAASSATKDNTVAINSSSAAERGRATATAASAAVGGRMATVSRSGMQATTADTQAIRQNTTARGANSKAVQAIVDQYAPAATQLEVVRRQIVTLSEAIRTNTGDARQNAIALEELIKKERELASAIHGVAIAYEAMKKIQNEEIEASNAAARARRDEARSASELETATRHASIAARAEKEATDDAAKAADKKAEASRRAAEAAEASARAMDKEARSARNDTEALGGAADAADAFASSGGGGGGGGGFPGLGGEQAFAPIKIPDWGAESLARDRALVDQFRGLQAAIIAASSALHSIGPPPSRPLPPKESAGATIASQPGAFGGDQNASFFYDPASRQTFMSQFGIKGDAATREGEREYQKQVQAYELQLRQYHEAKAHAAQQIWLMQKQLEELGKTRLAYGGRVKDQDRWGRYDDQGGSYQGGFASGGSFKVSGSPGNDNNLMSMRLSHGELVTITPPGQRGPGEQDRPVTVNLTINTPDERSFRKSRSSVVNQVAAMMEAATKNRTTNAR